MDELEKLKQAANELMEANEKIAQVAHGAIDRMIESNQSLIRIINKLL